MAKKLYVGNLDFATTETSLSELFATVGEVTSVALITDRMTGRSRGFAFVEMADTAGAKAAIEQLNGKDVDGRALKVAEARPREPRGGSPWGGGGGGGGGGYGGGGGKRRRY